MHLSPVQWRILELMSGHYSNQEICGILHISPVSMRIYLWRIYRRVDVSSRVELLAWYIENYADQEVRDHYIDLQYRGMQHITPTEWNVIDCICVQMLTLEEAAEAMNKRVGTVRRHYEAACEKLVIVHGIDALRKWYNSLPD